MASSKADPHPSGSRVPIAPIFSGQVLWPFQPGMITRDSLQKDKNKKCTTEHTEYNRVTWQKGTYFPSFPRVKLLVFLGRRRPSLLPADHSLVNGDLLCFSCVRVSLEACMDRVVSPPIWVLRCCLLLLLPKHRQFHELASGDL